MLKLKLYLIISLLFCSVAHAQSRAQEPTVFTKQNLIDFWKDNQHTNEKYAIGVFVDGGSVAKGCNGSVVLGVESIEKLSTYLKQAESRFLIQTKQYGKMGADNLMITSACSLINSDEIAWNIFKLDKFFKRQLTEEDKKNPLNEDKDYIQMTCFRSSVGISYDQPVNYDIWILVYTPSTYNMEDKTADYSRKAPYPYCDNFHEYVEAKK